jgi:hypothetical protein
VNQRDTVNGDTAPRKRLAPPPSSVCERLFFGHCRMELAWPVFDFAVDVTAVYERKREALTVYESLFSGSQAELLDKYTAEDRYVGSLVGVRYAEAFKSRSPLLVADPDAFALLRFG